MHSDLASSSDEDEPTKPSTSTVTIQDKEKTKALRQCGPNWKHQELQLLTDKVLGNMELLSGELSYTDDITNMRHQEKWQEITNAINALGY